MADKYISLQNGIQTEVEATVISGGAANAGEIPALDPSGKLSNSVMPVGVGPDVKSVVTSENLSAGDLVNIYDNAGTSTARKADNSNTRRAVGFVLAGTTSPAAASVYFKGTITGLSGLTAGSLMFLGVSGAATATAPSGTGVISQQIGTAISATEISFEPQPITVLA
jgi:hypothetical protein